MPWPEGGAHPGARWIDVSLAIHAKPSFMPSYILFPFVLRKRFLPSYRRASGQPIGSAPAHATPLPAVSRPRRQRDRAEPPRPRAAREPVRDALGVGRALQREARRVRALVLLPEGPGGPDRVRHVPHAGPVPGLPAPGWHAGGSARSRHALRAARQLPARGGGG